MRKILTSLLIIVILPMALHSREFLNTVVHLNFGGMYGLSTGSDIIDSEKSSIKTQIPDNTNISHYETAWNLTLDIVPIDPIILGIDEHAVKFGIRSTYGIHYLEQRVTDGVEIGDKVMEYRGWMIGPVIHYAPFIEPSDINENYSSNSGFTFYALYGRFHGDLTAYPSIRESGVSVADYKSGLSGYKINVGVGAEIALCSLNVGLNLYYSYINVDLKEKIYSDMDRNGKMNEVCLELYIGIPIESFIKPLIPKF